MRIRRTVVSLLAGLLLFGCALGAPRCEKELPFYNFKRAEYEVLCELPSDFHAYIPQTVSAQALYDLLVEEKGYAPVDAAKAVWTAMVGESEVEDGK